VPDCCALCRIGGELDQGSDNYEINGVSGLICGNFFYSQNIFGGCFMKLEWRLKQLLEKHHLYRHGVETQIAKDCGLHRHTIGKFLRNQVQNPRIEVLEKICSWLIEKGVPADNLPGALFGVRSSELWRAIGQSEKISIFLGEYHLRGKMTTVPQASPPVSMSRHDSVVSSKIIHFLFSETGLRDIRPVVKVLYVPFSYTPGQYDEDVGGLQEDKERARRIFKRMRENSRNETSTILIGSQRVNYLVEYMVADLFNCKPFATPTKEPEVPFYLCYRKFDRLIPSCFGGPGNPPGKIGDTLHGTYYLDENFEWQFLEWQRKKNDAGIVIVVREADNVEMAAFGFSGRATNAIGNALLEKSEQFWPETDSKDCNAIVVGKREVGVYICQVTFSEEGKNVQDWAYESFENDVVNVISLSHKVLSKFLR